ncbi:hypothetical protein L6258_02180 [Candidatus Parcubacteria bacterium]|nr:hypothetical protein [Candidatus Parcubacteria bacterium]
MGPKILVSSGPMIGQGMLFITLNLVAFLLTLVLVLRIGAGRIGQPIFLIGLGFLVSGLIPLILGIEYLWAVPVAQTLFGVAGIFSLMRALGVFQLIEEPAVKQTSAKSGK